MKTLRTILIALPLLLAGCGYTSGSLAPEGATTVGIEIFNNTSYVPDLEVELHRELIASVERSVPMRIVAPRDADIIVRGTILDYAGRGGIRGNQNKLLETGVRIRVMAELVRPEQTDEAMRQTGFSSESGFRLDETLGESRAIDRVMRNIADRVVLDLFTPLDYEPPVIDGEDFESRSVEGS